MLKIKNKNTIIAYLILFLAIALMMLPSGSVNASIKVLDGYQCEDLIAGETLLAGTICSEVSGEDLMITYTTVDDWELTEARIWVGTSLANMPQVRKGDPEIVNFPYQTGDISGNTRYQFLIPLKDLGLEAELCDPDRIFYLSAYAVLRKDDGKGGYQTKSGWGSQKQIIEQGSWAIYYTLQFSCDEFPPEDNDCETAFAFGDKELRSILDFDGNPITDKWGWQITIHPGDARNQPIFTSTGQNDITKGTYVGNLKILYSGSLIIAAYQMVESYTMVEIHLYVNTTETQTVAFSQFGNSHDLSDTPEGSFVIEIKDDPIYIVAHAVVCQSVESFD